MSKAKRLTAEIVTAIRGENMPGAAIALKYGISKQTAGDIRAGRTWKNAPGDFFDRKKQTVLYSEIRKRRYMAAINARRGFSDEDIVAAIDSGESPLDIAARFKCSRQVVWSIGSRYDRHQPGKRWPDWRVQQLRDLAAEGHAKAQIAKKMQASLRSVIGICDRMGIQTAVGDHHGRKPGIEAAVAALSVQLKSTGEIARETGVSTSTVRSIRRELTARVGEYAVQSEAFGLLSFPVMLPFSSSDTLALYPVSGRFECQWITGDTDGVDYSFCRCQAMPGRAWCQQHYHEVYQVRERRAA